MSVFRTAFVCSLVASNGARVSGSCTRALGANPRVLAKLPLRGSPSYTLNLSTPCLCPASCPPPVITVSWSWMGGIILGAFSGQDIFLPFTSPANCEQLAWGRARAREMCWKTHRFLGGRRLQTQTLPLQLPRGVGGAWSLGQRDSVCVYMCVCARACPLMPIRDPTVGRWSQPLLYEEWFLKGFLHISLLKLNKRSSRMFSMLHLTLEFCRS